MPIDYEFNLSFTELKTEFKEFRRTIERDFEDQKILIQQSADHASALQNSMLESQTQMQVALQRQLDQNNDQHKEIIALARDEVIEREMSGENRIRLVLEAQKKEDNEQNIRLLRLEEKVEKLEKDPLQKDSRKIEKIRDIIFTIIATGIIMAIIMWGKDFFENNTGIKIPIKLEAPKE